MTIKTIFTQENAERFRCHKNLSRFFVMLILAFSLIISSAFALTDYNGTGGSDNDFRQGSGIFDEDNDKFTLSIASQIIENTARDIPLVADLDNDGSNEIVIMDYPVIKLFQTASLIPLSSFTIGVLDERISNVILFDIDDDNLTEIIFVREESQILQIIQWNGTKMISDFTVDASTILKDLGINGIPEYMIQCGSPQQCFMVATEGSDASPSADRLVIAKFNTTNVSNRELLLTESGSGGADNLCLPKIRSIPFEDYDKDGRNEFIFSVMDFNTGQDEIIHIYFIDINKNGSLETEYHIQDDDFKKFLPLPTSVPINPVDAGFGSVDCDAIGNLESFFTSPLVFDSLEDTDGLETIVGLSVDADEFNMISYTSRIQFSTKCEDNDDCQLDNFPTTFDANGVILSNVFRMNAFTQTGENDFCVLGFNEVEEELDLLCATERDTDQLFGVDNREYTFPIGNLSDISSAYRNLDILTHSVQMRTQSPNNFHEILTTYGVFVLDDTRFTGLVTRALDLIFDIDQSNGVSISVDAEKINVPLGSEDILYLTDTNIFYFDDGRTNSPAVIVPTVQAFNPCTNAGAIKVNTTTTIKFIVNDIDDDIVFAKLFLYADDVNEQETILRNGSAGTEFSFTVNKDGLPLLYNKTGNGIIRLEAFDIENPAIVDTEFNDFEVSLSGVEFGDCTEDLIPIPPEEEGVGDICVSDGDCNVGLICGVDNTCEIEEPFFEQDDERDNAIINGLRTITGLSGLSFTTIWVILMLAFSTAIYFRGALIGMSGSAILGAIAFINVLFIFLGARLGVLSTGLVVIIVIVGVVIIGVFLGKFFTGVSRMDTG